MRPLLGSQYDDEQLVMRAERALAEHPIVEAARLDVSSENGVVTVSGRAASQLARRHAIDVVRHAFEVAGLRYAQIVDEIVVGEHPRDMPRRQTAWPQSEYEGQEFDERNWNPEHIGPQHHPRREGETDPTAIDTPTRSPLKQQP